MAPSDRQVAPDWSTRVRRAIVGIGLVWIFVGAGVTTYFTVTAKDDDVIRGVLTMILGCRDRNDRPTPGSEGSHQAYGNLISASPHEPEAGSRQPAGSSRTQPENVVGRRPGLEARDGETTVRRVA